MRQKLAIFFALSLVLLVPRAWSAIIRHGSVGPLSIEVFTSPGVIVPGGTGHADVLVTNNSATAAMDVAYTAQLRFSDGSTSWIRFQPDRFTLQPGEGMLTSVTYAVPSSASSGPGEFLSGARILAVHEAGGTRTPPEPTGAWSTDVLQVQ